MRKFSKISITVKHEENEESNFSVPVVEMMNGSNSVQVSKFENALEMLPPESFVSVTATGTVGNNEVHNLSRIIREGKVFVDLDLSKVKELSRVFDSPFQGNCNLVSISFPKNIASINPAAFANCKNLESVIIPKTVKKIGIQAFSGCEKLTKLKFEKIEGWFYEKDGNKVEISNLGNEEDNPYRFTLPSSPYRNCELLKK